MEKEFERWSRNFSGSDFLYGLDPGPVARRAVRYHQPASHLPQRALDVGCGEGQDLVFLAEQGYETTGLDFTSTGLDKARRLLTERNQNARLVQSDILGWPSNEQFDLVLAVNCLQFLGADAPTALQHTMNWVAPGGVIGLSMFARDEAGALALEDTIYRWTLEELLQTFAACQPFEATKLWQWGGPTPQLFVTLIAQKPLI